tara:strand:- start:592 stop:990 length:399 start_codon:yes stop_codon:yes gene_type:complete
MSFNGDNSLFLTIQQPAPNDYGMGNGVSGTYDGKILKPGGASTWRHQPNNKPLNTVSNVVVQGNQVPLANESVNSLIPSDSMFYFANNVTSLDCCPSTYSTDTGCVCTTEQQRKFIGQQRGNNKNAAEYPSI